jgi:hypothetical protein
MPVTGIHQYPFRSGMQEAGLYWIRFETNNTSNPDGLVDPAGVVSTVVRTSQSLFTVTLNKRWARIGAWATYEEAEAILAQVTTHVEGSAAANTVVVRVVDEAITLNADTTDKTINVFMILTRRQ